ncbi:folate transporter 1 [Quercus suber]|uniref:Folate transporter 1 n=1 Tax=Quercus suber TaxID=58331 RepID=A0AAW0K0K3_QUESU
MSQSQSQSKSKSEQWQWENATAGAAAGFATVAAMHPLDVVRTRFQVNDGRVLTLPSYKNTAHAIFTIARLEGLRGLYAGFNPAVIGSTVSWGLYFFFYDRAKQRHSKNKEGKLSAGLHLASAAEAGALQRPSSDGIPRYMDSWHVVKETARFEGVQGFYKGITPNLLKNVPAASITFIVYENVLKLLKMARRKD